jgi:P27 family predicted phage terminase small subunit
MDAIDGTGQIVSPPEWALLLTDGLEVEAARRHWDRITNEMRERETLAPSNGHAIQRLVLAYVIFDRCSREVADQGAVLKPKRGNPKSIARLSPHFTAMREAGNDAERMEAELGLTPRRRGAVTKVQRKVVKRTGADRFLKPVAK